MDSYNTPLVSDKSNIQLLKRVGLVIEIRPECIEEYRKLHAQGHFGIRDLLVKYHLRNFSIFLHQIDDRWFEFGYYEYAGRDYDADMAALAAEQGNQEWLNICKPMHLPLNGEIGWAKMEQIFFNP
ncbi:MAG: L-rhamnose mutarotase [Verrucomicrobiota bacterium]